MDVSPIDYYYKAILWAAERGIVAGTSPARFSPNQVCTRGQIVMILWKAAGSPRVQTEGMSFADVLPTDYYSSAVRWAAAEGITAGTSENLFSPEQMCTRGQIAVFLWRAEKISLTTKTPEPAGAQFGTDSIQYILDLMGYAVTDGQGNSAGMEILKTLYALLFGDQTTQGEILAALLREAI